jgi:hypothetical protein
MNAPAGTLQRGIVRNGIVLPGTEWCLREPGAWWTAGERGTKARSSTTLIVAHWTAGGRHEGPGTAQRVVRNMKARKRDDGTPMEVGIHFVIGWDGMCFQTADLDVATVHVSAGWNPRSIGVECCWPGTMSNARKIGAVDLHDRGERRHVAGARVDCLPPPSELLASYVRLCETLALHCGIPRVVPLAADGHPLLDRMTAKRARSWEGAAEHLHSPSTTKVDAAGYLCGALQRAGWRGVVG